MTIPLHPLRKSMEEEGEKGRDLGGGGDRGKRIRYDLILKPMVLVIMSFTHSRRLTRPGQGKMVGRRLV